MTSEATGVVDSRLADYELVVIVSPGGGDESLEATVDAVSKIITGSGGTVVTVERWGKRKLAYPIKQFLEGGYFLVHFKAKPSLGRELEANLHISEDVLRHLLIKLESS